MRRTIALLLSALLIGAVLLAAGCGEKKESKVTEKPPNTIPEDPVPDSAPPPPEFVQEQFAFRTTINFVRSEPANNQLLTTTVDRVAVFFNNHDLGGGSFIEVTRDGLDVTDGPPVIAMDLRSVSVKVKADKTGNYKVNFTPYFSSGYYETGKFGFSVKLE